VTAFEPNRSAVTALRPRIRIALVGEYPITEDAIHEGGIQSVTYALAHALARRPDVECHVVSAMSHATTSYRRVGALNVHYVRRLPLPRLATYRTHDVPKMLPLIRSIKPDVVHGQGQDRHALAALDSKLPTVITPHGVAFIEGRQLKRHAWDALGAIKKYLVTRIEQDVFRRASDMVIISRYLPQIYGSLLTARTHFIENPINEEYFHIARAPQAGRLLFVGTVVPRKCVHDLVRAVSEVLRRNGDEGGSAAKWKAKLQLRIAGPILSTASEALIRRVIEETGLQNRVTFLGALSQGELLEEYARAQMLLMASREETTPQVIAQAMACGLPIVASRVGGIPNMVQDGKSALLFPLGDITACAQHIFRLLDDECLRESMQVRILEEARLRFHPESVAEQTVRVYREVIERKTT